MSPSELPPPSSRQAGVTRVRELPHPNPDRAHPQLPRSTHPRPHMADHIAAQQQQQQQQHPGPHL